MIASPGIQLDLLRVTERANQVYREMIRERGATPVAVHLPAMKGGITNAIKRGLLLNTLLHSQFCDLMKRSRK